MSDKPVKGTKRATTANTELNAMSAFIETKIRDGVNTSDLVTIGAADDQGNTSTGGYAAATPIVAQTDGFNNAIPTTEIPKLPVWRPQAGKAAILMKPQPGDKAIAVFMKRDSSGIGVETKSSIPPGSFRNFDQADGVLINGVLGEAPEIWLLLDPETGKIELSTKAANLDIECREEGDILIKTGSGDITIQAGSGGGGTITLDGQVVVTRNIIVQNKNNEGQSQMTGGFSNTGGQITSNAITLETHLHKGVQTGSGDTGTPNTGT